MNQRPCQYCGKTFKTSGIGTHEKSCKNKVAKTGPPVAITEEFLSALLQEADELEARVRELRDLAEKLKQYPQIKGYTLMIREDADVQG